MFSVRRFVSEDLKGLLIVRRESIRNVNARDYNAAQIQAWAGDTDDLKAQGKRFGESLTWVAEQDGTIIGYTNLIAETGYLDSLFVHSKFQRRGIASALLESLEQTALRESIERLTSDVSITAQPFFENRQFVVLKAQRVLNNGQEFDNFRMEKKLQA